MKVVISNPKTGKSYQTEVEETKSRALYGAKIGEEIDGSLIGLSGYKLKITGGTDKDGFPMRPDVHGMERKKILISSGPGIKRKGKGERKKKTVRGNVISEHIAQVNVTVTKEGGKLIPEVLGIVEKKEEKTEKEKKEKKVKEEKVEKEKPEEEKTEVKEEGEKSGGSETS